MAKPKKSAAKPKAKAAAKKATGTKALTKVNRAIGKALELDDMLAQDSQMGMEGMDATDMSIPFLAIVQSNSPQRHRNHEKFIKDAEEGDIFNTVSGELFESVRVVPCRYVKQFIEWIPRDAGGGFVAAHERHAPIIQTAVLNGRRQLMLPNGNNLVETATFYCMQVVDDGYYPVVLSMTSTQLKKARRWNTVMQQRKLKHAKSGNLFSPPMFAYCYTIGTCDESNDQGQWKGFTIDLEGERVEDTELYAACKAFSVAASEGAATAGYHTLADVIDDGQNETDGENY